MDIFFVPDVPWKKKYCHFECHKVRTFGIDLEQFHMASHTVGEGNGTPLQYSCLENPMGRLSDFTFTFHFHAFEKEMATHSSVLAWRIPGTGEPGGLPSMGSHRVGHDWSDLAAVTLYVSCSHQLPCFNESHIKFCQFRMSNRADMYVCKLPSQVRREGPAFTAEEMRLRPACDSYHIT